jgi:hypothetical protein
VLPTELGAQVIGVTETAVARAFWGNIDKA